MSYGSSTLLNAVQTFYGHSHEFLHCSPFVFLYFSLPPFPPCRLLLFSSSVRTRVSFLFVSVPFFVHFSILSRRINPIRARQSIKGHTVIHVFVYPRASLSLPISNCNIGNDGSREFDSSTKWGSKTRLQDSGPLGRCTTEDGQFLVRCVSLLIGDRRPEDANSQKLGLSEVYRYIFAHKVRSRKFTCITNFTQDSHRLIP